MSPSPAAPRQASLAAIDNYFLDEDLDDPFASPSPKAGQDKRGAPEALGIDEEVQVKKRAREPRVKLDETRLLSENGIPRLRQKAKVLKFKGKGHEFSDARRLLSFYQLWLDDLFPKAKFLDALAMVEKTGHQKGLHRVRMEWINEGKPRAPAEEESEGFDTALPVDAVVPVDAAMPPPGSRPPWQETQGLSPDLEPDMLEPDANLALDEGTFQDEEEAMAEMDGMW